MPELPDLEIMREILDRRVLGRRIETVEVLRPTVVRALQPGTFAEGWLQGRIIEGINRRAKFLIFDLGQARYLAMNLMLAGRLRFCVPGERRRTRDYMLWGLGETELRYYDPKGMGKVYLTTDLETIPGWSDMGPDALDPALSEADFRARLCAQRGEIKSILTGGKCVAGIGNAYADEILFAAGLYPFRKRPSLTDEEEHALYSAMRDVLSQAIVILRERMGDEIDQELRDFLQVHQRKGQPCSRCGQAISEVNVARRMTNFCRHCQPGSLLTR